MDERIAVSVHSTDLLSRAGALSQLKDQTGLAVIEPTTQHADGAVLTHRVDDPVMVDLLGQLMAHVGRMNRTPASTPSPAMSAHGLTSREIDVLRLLAEGLDTRQIAEKLTYSECTIKTTSTPS